MPTTRIILITNVNCFLSESRSRWTIPKYTVNIVIDFIDMMMNGFFSNRPMELVLLQIIFVALHEMLVHRCRCLVFKIFVHLPTKKKIGNHWPTWMTIWALLWTLEVPRLAHLHPTAICDLWFVNYDVFGERSQVANEIEIGATVPKVVHVTKANHPDELSVDTGLLFHCD